MQVLWSPNSAEEFATYNTELKVYAIQVSGKLVSKFTPVFSCLDVFDRPQVQNSLEVVTTHIIESVHYVITVMYVIERVCLCFGRTGVV